MVKRNGIGVAGILIALYFLITLAPPLPGRIGQVDFAGYWSATDLLSRSENFTDDQNLLTVQQTMTTLNESYPMKTWNAPWLLVLLLPLVLFPFQQAALGWLLVNITLLFVTAVWLYQMIQVDGKAIYFGLGLALLFFFPSTLVALLFGQVNILVLFGLVAFLRANERSHYFVAGCALVLTLVKPQLVYITLPILLLDSLHQRKWAVCAGIFSTLLGLTFITFFFRPTFVTDYLISLSRGTLLAWQNPTLSSYLHAVSGWGWVRWLGIGALGAMLGIWYRYRGKVSARNWLEITLLLSVITTPFAWSYDFVILFVPMMGILGYQAQGKLSQWTTVGIAVTTAVLYGVAYYQRLLSPNELFFFWIPLAIAGIYGWSRIPISTVKRVNVWN